MRLLLFILLLTLLFACKLDNKSTGIQSFDLETNLRKNIDSTLTWNDLATNISISPLETGDSSLLASFSIQDIVGDKIVGINRVMNVTKEGWMILSGSKADIRIFDINGKQQQVIDRLGKGGEEYTEIVTVLAGREPFTVKVVNDKNLLTYTPDGKFLSRDSMAKNYFKIAHMDKGKYIGDNPNYPIQDYKYMVSVMDEKGKIIAELLPVQAGTTRQPAFTSVSLLASVPGGVLYLDRHTDTVYRITPEIKAEPYCVFQCGPYAGINTKNIISTGDITKYFQDMEKYITISGISPFHDRFLVNYSFEGKSYWEVWEQGGASPIARKKGPYGEGFTFRFDNGETLDIQPQLIQDNKAYFILDAYKVVDKIPGITEESNPVLIIIDLK